jgi:hypothetical protein
MIVILANDLENLLDNVEKDQDEKDQEELGLESEVVEGGMPPKEIDMRNRIQSKLSTYGDNIGKNAKKAFEDLIVGTIYDSEFSIQDMAKILVEIGANIRSTSSENEMPENEETL